MHRKHLVLALALLFVLIATFAVGYIASAEGVSITGLQPAGTFRYAAVSATTPINTTSTSFVDVPGLSTNIRVPAGKTAEFIIEFSAVVNSADALSTHALVDSTEANPGATQIYYSPGSVGASSHGFNYYLSGIGPGNHRVVIQWSGLGGQQFMSKRSMVVIANIH